MGTITPKFIKGGVKFLLVTILTYIKNFKNYKKIFFIKTF